MIRGRRDQCVCRGAILLIRPHRRKSDSARVRGQELTGRVVFSSASF